MNREAGANDIGVGLARLHLLGNDSSKAGNLGVVREPDRSTL